MQQNCHKIKTFAPAIFLDMSSNMLDKKAIDKTNALSKVAFYTAIQKALDTFEISKVVYVKRLGRIVPSH